MLIRFNTDESVDGSEGLGRHAEELTRQALQRFADRITRVEIHVSDVNGSKSGALDKRCLMEARMAGRRPIAVREHSATVHQAIEQAARKMSRRLDSTLGKLVSRRRGAEPMSGKRSEAPAATPGDDDAS
jgi:ribosome-associated translation inhibitor RaiA